LSAQIQMVGEELSHHEEFAIANWAGSRLDTHYSSYSEAFDAIETMQQEAEKQGFSPAAKQLVILRREVKSIAGTWSQLG